MKVDLYTKAVLTLIALGIGWIALRPVELVGTARADDIYDRGKGRTTVNCNISEIGGFPLIPRAALPVTIEEEPRPGQ